MYAQEGLLRQEEGQGEQPVPTPAVGSKGTRPQPAPEMTRTSKKARCKKAQECSDELIVPSSSSDSDGDE
jgi:hypothetical protein